MPAKFVLIGSGLAGGLLAAYLGRRGYEVDLHERRADPREGNIVGGRSINLTDAVCRLETETGKLVVRGDAVIGVDGAFSAVRASMQRNIDSFQYNESYLAHGYKELTIPPAPDGSWLIEKNALHIWPRKSF